MKEGTITEGQILTGVMFNEPMRVITTRQSGAGAVVAGRLVGQSSGQFREVTLTAEDIAQLNAIDPNASYDGDGELLKLALQAYSLGIAHEFDPYFGLSISRVDPLPHQLEAVYEYFMKLPSVRFLLADDAGAGKTIMAGLLIRELKLRGLVERMLIVCPANLTFQWQREMLGSAGCSPQPPVPNRRRSPSGPGQIFCVPPQRRRVGMYGCRAYTKPKLQKMCWQPVLPLGRATTIIDVARVGPARGTFLLCKQ